MKKSAIVIIILLFLLGGAVSVSASAPQTASAKIRMTEKARSRVRSWWVQAQRRLEALIGRLSPLADRVNARLDKLAAAGKDVSKQRADLASARDKIDAAKQQLADAAGQIDAIIADNTPSAAFLKIHDLNKAVLGAISDANRMLTKVWVLTRNLSTTP